MQKPSSAATSLLLLFLLSVHLQAQICQQGSSDLLQSGSTVLSNSYSGSAARRQHLYQFTVGYTVPQTGIQIAASASSFSVSPSNGMDFSIRGLSSSGNSATIVLLMNEDSSWSSIRVSYLVSSRPDLLLGTFSADPYRLQTNAAGSFSLVYEVPNWQGAGTYNAIVRIAGVRTFSTTMSLILNSAAFSNGQLMVSLSVSSSTPVELVYLTYLIGRSGSAVTFNTFYPTTGSSASYQFTGIDQLTNNGANMLGTAIYLSSSGSSSGFQCAGAGCPSVCVSYSTCVGLGGQLIGSSCLICAPGQTIANGNCQTSIGGSCGSNQYFDGSKCVCNNAYVLVSGSCYQQCTNNGYLYNSQCLCLPGYISSNGNCLPNNAPTPSCGQNYVSSNGNCICPSPFGLIGNLCLSCPSGSYLSGGVCICTNGVSLSQANPTCSNGGCYANAYRNSLGQCACNDGYYNQGGQCISQGNCQNGQIWNGSGCACPTGKVLDTFNKNCTYCNTPDRAVTGSTCTCSPYFYPTAVGCSPCPSNSIYNPTTANCVCGNNYIMQNGQCIMNPNCPYNSRWNSTTQRCDCNNFQQYVINGFCQSCTIFSTWNGVTCVCESGYIMDVAGACNKVCPPNSVPSGPTCACIDGYYKLLGLSTCVQCDPNSVFVPSLYTCVCRAGFFGTYNNCNYCHPSCATCSGASSNQCLSCANQATLSNGVCLGACSSGYYIDPNNQCTPCMANCILCYSASSCAQCQIGYVLTQTNSGGTIILSCTQSQIGSSGTNSIITLGGKSIGNNVVYQGVMINMLPTSILASNCAACDNILSVQISSAYTAITTSVAYVLNSNYWFLITFTFPRVSFVPNFQFTLQLNSQYASSFSPASMAQQLIVTISATNFYQSAANPTSLMTAPAPMNLFTASNPSSTLNAQAIAAATKLLGGNSGIASFLFTPPK